MLSNGKFMSNEKAIVRCNRDGGDGTNANKQTVE